MARGTDNRKRVAHRKKSTRKKSTRGLSIFMQIGGKRRKVRLKKLYRGGDMLIMRTPDGKHDISMGAGGDGTIYVGVVKQGDSQTGDEFGVESSKYDGATYVALKGFMTKKQIKALPKIERARVEAQSRWAYLNELNFLTKLMKVKSDNIVKFYGEFERRGEKHLALELIGAPPIDQYAPISPYKDLSNYLFRYISTVFGGTTRGIKDPKFLNHEIQKVLVYSALNPQQDPVRQLWTPPEHIMKCIDSILMGCCRGLTAIHTADVCHMDIKPQNIFMQLDLTTTDPSKIFIPKIGDFGLSHEFNDFDRNAGGQGTADYLPPEALNADTNTIREHNVTGGARDNWGMGLTLLETIMACVGVKKVPFIEFMYGERTNASTIVWGTRPGQQLMKEANLTLVASEPEEGGTYVISRDASNRDHLEHKWMPIVRALLKTNPLERTLSLPILSVD